MAVPEVLRNPCPPALATYLWDGYQPPVTDVPFEALRPIGRAPRPGKRRQSTALALAGGEPRSTRWSRPATPSGPSRGARRAAGTYRGQPGAGLHRPASRGRPARPARAVRGAHNGA